MKQTKTGKRSQSKRPRGRPSAVTREVLRAVLRRIEGGKFLLEALAGERVSRSAFYRAIERFPEFRDALKTALVSQMNTTRDLATATIRKAFRRSWQAAAWWLERNWPAEFGRRLATEVSGPGGRPVQVATVAEGPPLVDVVRSEVLAELAQALKSAGDARPLEVANDYFTHKVEAARALMGEAGPVSGGDHAFKLRIRYAYIGKLQRLVMQAKRLGGHDLTAAQILDAVRTKMPPPKAALETKPMPEPTEPRPESQPAPPARTH
jgi:hypothetical protein